MSEAFEADVGAAAGALQISGMTGTMHTTHPHQTHMSKGNKPDTREEARCESSATMTPSVLKISSFDCIKTDVLWVIGVHVLHLKYYK